MEQNIVIAIDHSAEAEQAVKCELRGVHMKVEGRGMTNYPNGPHRTQSDHIGPNRTPSGPNRTPICIILPVHITFRA